MPKFIKLQTIDHGEMLVNVHYIAGVYTLRLNENKTYTMIANFYGKKMAVNNTYEEVVKLITE